MTAYAKLKEKTDQYTVRIARSGLSPYETMIAYYSVFLPMVQYSLGVMTHSRKALVQLQKGPTNSTLLKMNFRRNIARAVVFGSPLYGGLGFRHFYVEQGIAQLLLFLRHLRADSEQGKLLRITLSWWQLKAGLSRPLMQHTSQPLPYLDDIWLTSVRAFLGYIGGSVTILDALHGMPKPTRLHDLFLMDVVTALPDASKSELEGFNRVRMYYGVTLLSEISTADGMVISSDAWTGSRRRHSPLLWPYQPKPGTDSFQAWRRLLNSAFLGDQNKRVSSKTVSRYLEIPLGKWMAGSDWLQYKWPMQYCYESQRLFWWDEETHSHSQHTRLERSRCRTTKFEVDPEQTQVTLPATAIPVDGHANDQFIIFPSVASLRPDPRSSPRTEPTYQYFEDYIKALPEWDRLLVTDTNFADMQEDLLCDLIEQNAQLILSSDGGAADCNGSYGSLAASRPHPDELEGKVLIEVGGRAFGDDPGSFRAEGYGELAIIRLIFHVIIFYKLKPTCNFHFLCDNQGLLTRIEKGLKRPYVTPRHFLISDIDVEMQILDTIRQLNRPTSFEHIKSHQDEAQGHGDQPLSWEVQLNTKCDASATAQLRKLTDPATKIPLPAEKLVPFLPASKVALEIQGQSITRKIPSQIRHICGSTIKFNNKHNQKIYLCNRHGWTMPEFESIDWRRFRSALHDRGFSRKLFLIKWINHLLSFMQRQRKYGMSPLAACPSDCGCPEEDDTHFLRCPNPERLAVFTSLRTDLTESFTKHNADPWLRQILFSHLANFDSAVTFNLNALTAPYLQLVEGQSALGEDALFYGFFHQFWHQLQHAYLKQQHKPCDRNQESSTVKFWITRFHKAAHDLWLIRNHHLHRKEGPAARSFSRIILLMEVQDQYTHYNDVLYNDREPIYGNTTEEERKEHSIPQLNQWLKFAKPLITKSCSDAAAVGLRGSRITDFFHTARPPEED